MEMYSSYHLEDIVVSLALARKLKELNVEYPTPFYWRVWDDGHSDCVISECDYDKRHSKIKERIPTYTTSQLIEKLPFSFTFQGIRLYFSISKNEIFYKVSYKPDRGEITRCERKLENALARMLLWLSEIGVVK